MSFDMLMGTTDSLLSLRQGRLEMAQLVEECWALSNCQNSGEIEFPLDPTEASNCLPRVKRERDIQWEPLGDPSCPSDVLGFQPDSLKDDNPLPTQRGHASPVLFFTF